jgi:hypothetical protein
MLDMNPAAEVVMDGSRDDQNAINTQDGTVPPPPPAYADPRERAKLRKTDNTLNNLATSAASDEEDHLAQ